jgi:ZIP family zinc transporter
MPDWLQAGGWGLLAGSAIAVGALLDGVPESVVIGASLLAGGAVSLVTVVAVFLSNVPEGLSSAAGMRQAGRTRRYVFTLWTGIALISGASSLAGYTLLVGLITAGFLTAFALSHA